MDPPLFSILTPNAMLGYGYRQDNFWYGVEMYRPRAVIVDSGSTDGGPYKLGMNKMTCGRDAYIRDLTPMLEACFYRKITVMIGSTGGDGSNSHVEEMLDIVREIADGKSFSLKIATIKEDIPRDLIKRRIRDGKCSPCGPLDPLVEEEVDAAVEIVAQMGAESFMKVLEIKPDVIIGGRSYYPAPFAGFCMFHGVEPPAAWHMGKIMECGGICAVPKGRCTPLSVAAHTLYEKIRPDRLPGPRGVLVLDGATYEQPDDDKTVRVSGATFVPSSVYQIKLEGVKKLGYRTIFIGGIRDPILISQIDDYLEKVRQHSKGLFPDLDESDHCCLIYHVYGRNAVMGPLEPEKLTHHELGIMGEVVAETQERSHTIANNAAGGVFKFSVYYLIELNKGEELSLFPIAACHVGSAGEAELEPLRLTEEELEAFRITKPLPIEKKQVSPEVVPMMSIAKVVRSKNSGPFELTLDIMFDDCSSFERVKSADLLTNDTI